jgi:hypothetical protein
VPDISVEVDDVDEAYSRAKSAGYEIVRDLETRPGVCGASLCAILLERS